MSGGGIGGGDMGGFARGAGKRVSFFLSEPEVNKLIRCIIALQYFVVCECYSELVLYQFYITMSSSDSEYFDNPQNVGSAVKKLKISFFYGRKKTYYFQAQGT